MIEIEGVKIFQISNPVVAVDVNVHVSKAW